MRAAVVALVAAPLVGAALNLLLGRKLARWAGWLASGLVAASFVAALVLLRELLRLPVRQAVVHLYDWIRVGGLRADVDIRIDPLSVTMALLATGVGALIHVYSIGYMAGDPRIARFFAYLNLFIFSMLLLVLAENFGLLYVGWEGVGLSSYLLIGFWFDRPSAARAAKKAFLTTRVGDAALFVGVAWIFARFGSVDFQRVLTERAAQGISTAAYTGIALLLLVGAIGKSAQIPLHVWLPDAMEGPTPVSALIHAATMVTAGVYLVVRTHVLFEFSGVALTVVLVVGLITAVYAALCAVAQNDIKRALAYSTISQLGFMFFAAGARAYGAAMFLLITQAFYKSLMFLGAGSVIRALNGETDLRRMGGLVRTMPVTAGTFLIGALALAGVPPLSGFFSKDQILAIANQSGRQLAWVVASLGGFLSALYISRVLFLTFLGPSRDDRHAHESPPVMAIPMLVLAGAAATGGALGFSSARGVLVRFLAPVVNRAPEPISGLSETTLAWISTTIALSAVVAAFVLYGTGAVAGRLARRHASRIRVALEAGLYVDAAYATLIRTVGAGSAAFLASAVDQRMIDRAVDGIGRTVTFLASIGRQLQAGLVRRYALVFLAGVVAIFLYMGLRL